MLDAVKIIFLCFPFLLLQKILRIFTGSKHNVFTLDKQATNIWSITYYDGSFEGINSNCTIFKVPNSKFLILFLPVEPSSNIINCLKDIGTVRYIVVYNIGHYKNAKLWWNIDNKIKIIYFQNVFDNNYVEMCEGSCEEVLPSLGVKFYKLPGLFDSFNDYLFVLPIESLNNPSSVFRNTKNTRSLSITVNNALLICECLQNHTIIDIVNTKSINKKNITNINSPNNNKNNRININNNENNSPSTREKNNSIYKDRRYNSPNNKNVFTPNNKDRDSSSSSSNDNSSRRRNVSLAAVINYFTGFKDVGVPHWFHFFYIMDASLYRRFILENVCKKFRDSDDIRIILFGHGRPLDGDDSLKILGDSIRDIDF